MCSYLAIKQCRYELAVDMCLGNLFYKKEDIHFTFNLSTSKTDILTLKRYALLYYISTCIKLLDMLIPTYQKYYSLSNMSYISFMIRELWVLVTRRYYLVLRTILCFDLYCSIVTCSCWLKRQEIKNFSTINCMKSFQPAFA